MKVRVMRPTEVEVETIHLQMPIKYGTNDMPEKFPGRAGNLWMAFINIDTGIIQHWPAGVDHDLYMKVTDGGVYGLYGPDGRVAALEGYVPHGVVPGDYGDYVHLKIVGGKIANWPKRPDVSEFFPGDEEE